MRALERELAAGAGHAGTGPPGQPTGDERTHAAAPGAAHGTAAGAARDAASGGAGDLPSGGARVLAVVHVYYPDLWDELAGSVTQVAEPVDLVVTLVQGVSDHIAGRITGQFPGAVVRVVENHGRDIWPLLQVLDTMAGHDAVLKLHTKKSPHMRNGEQWRRRLLDGLCGSTQRTADILRLLREHPRIGMVVPPRSALGREFLSANRARVRELARRGGIPFQPAQLWFPAGSMFWTRPEVLLDLAALGLDRHSFEPESGAIDATMAHAVERYLGAILAARGLAVVETPDVDRLLGLRTRR